MARGPRYRVPFRRRREGKTDYRLRRGLVKSGLPRLVVRGSSRHMNVQLIKARVVGDEVLASAHSRELVRDYGWKGGCGNLPAAYLTGLLCGFKAVARGVREAVLDIGLQTPSAGARVFAALKGFLDAGGIVPHDESVIPSWERLKGQHIADYASQLSSDPELYKRRFSKYLTNGLPPEELPKHFLEVKDRITSSFRGGGSSE